MCLHGSSMRAARIVTHWLSHARQHEPRPAIQSSVVGRANQTLPQRPSQPGYGYNHTQPLLQCRCNIRSRLRLPQNRTRYCKTHGIQEIRLLERFPVHDRSTNKLLLRAVTVVSVPSATRSSRCHLRILCYWRRWLPLRQWNWQDVLYN